MLYTNRQRRGWGFRRFWLLCGAIFFAVVVDSRADDLPSDRMAEGHGKFFKTYCQHCHGPGLQEGKVRLDNLPFEVGKDVQTADTWKKILGVLNAGEMPPAEEPQPTTQEKADLLEELSEKLVVAREKLADRGNEAVMRRLNRREYQNTIRDLLEVEVDVKNLPSDTGNGGFDTVGASLYFSPHQFERYLKLGRQALDEAIVDPKAEPPKSQQVDVDVEKKANREAERFYEKFREQFRRHLEWLASDGKRPATDFGFLDEPRARRARKLYFKNTPHYFAWLSRPHTDTGVYLSDLHSSIDLGFDEETPPGRYLIRLHIGATENAPANRRFIDFGLNVDVGGRRDFQILRSYQVAGTIDQPQVIEIPLTIGKTGPRDFVIREMRPDYSPRGKWKHLREALNVEKNAPSLENIDKRLGWIEQRLEELVSPHGELSEYIPKPALWVDRFEIEGPIGETWPPAPHRRIFFEGPNAERDDEYASQIIARFAERAFRGQKPESSYVDRLVGIYRQHLETGKTFENAVAEALAVVLASPSFLYLNETTDENGAEKLSGLELATRLSYFLWSAPPDDELLAAARDGSLHQPDVMRQQVDRMLDSPKSWEFVTGFTHQWLDLDRIDLFQFDRERYPDFNESLKLAAVKEVYHFVGTILRENLSARNLLSSDFIVVNGLMAEYYGIKGVAGEEWQKVKLPDSSPRGGLIGTACILAMGSDGQETNPVERGAWVLRKLLNDPPPPAPPNVPQLSQVSPELLTHRERLAVHRKDPQCFHCHRKIDPIGFGLENFDAAGHWRDQQTFQLSKKLVKELYPDARGKERKAKQEQVRPIDAGGKLHGGPAFEDYFDLREILASRIDPFSRGLIEALLEYGLGRPISFSDEQLVTELHQKTKRDGYRLKSLIHAIVQTKTFQTR